MTKHLTALLLIFIIVFSLKAQEQSVTEVSEEIPSDSTGRTVEKKWRNLITNDVDEKNLIKIDVIPFFNRGIGLGYERRLGNANSAWSFYEYTEAYADNITTSKYSKLSDYLSSYRVTANAGPRYYYNKSSRIRKGKNANSFSSNYIGLNLYGDYSQHGRGVMNQKTYAGAAGLNFGIQRRLGKIGFIDWNIESGYINRWNNYISFYNINSQTGQYYDVQREFAEKGNFYLRSKLRVGIAF
jgi:hypothetical protein